MAHFQDRSDLLPSLGADVFRIDLDVTDDGLPELFLAHSQSSGTSGVSEWFVYERVGSNAVRFLDIIAFSYLQFRLDAENRFEIYLGTGQGAGRLVTYNVGSSGFEIVRSREAIVAGGPETNAFEEWRRKAEVRISVADWSQLSTGQEQWRDVATDEVVTGLPRLFDLLVQN